MSTEREALAALMLRLDALQAELAAAYAELRKQRPAITAVFDRDVWDRAAQKKGTQGTE